MGVGQPELAGFPGKTEEATCTSTSNRRSATDWGSGPALRGSFNVKRLF